MGSGESQLLGPQIETNGIFPALSSIHEQQELAANALEAQQAVGNIAGFGASFVPAIGPFLAFIIPLLSSMDFGGIQSALQKAEIDESILQNDINNYNAEVNSIKTSYSRLQQPQLTIQQQQPEIVYALRRSEYLFSLFENRNHLFYRHPMVSMPHFIMIMNILWANIQVANRLDPSMKPLNDRTILRMSTLRSHYESQFFETRMNRIYPVDYRGYQLTFDRPWKSWEVTNSSISLKTK